MAFDMTRIGQRIAALRREHDMTQMELAERLGISFQAVSSWERGQTMPDIAKLPELSSLFEISIDGLLGGTSAAKLVSDVAQDQALPPDAPAPAPEVLAEAAPVLRPSQVENLLEAGPPPSMTDLSRLAPFLDTQTVDALALQAVDDSINLQSIAALAPFMSSKALDDLALRAAGEDMDLKSVASLAPFMSSKALDDLALRAAGEDMDLKSVASLAPFMSSKAIDALALRAAGEDVDPKSIASIAPFMSSNALDEIALRVYAKCGVAALSSILPFLGKNVLQKILRTK